MAMKRGFFYPFLLLVLFLIILGFIKHFPQAGLEGTI